MNYNTVSKRRIASADRLSMIDQYYTDAQNLERRASVSLAALQIEGYPDFQYRNICYDCACQIYYAYKEGDALGSFGINRNNKGYRWIAPTTVYLTSYAPASEVVDASGTRYDTVCNDVAGCWSMFKTYGGRNSWLNDWKEVYDDDYVRQRFLRDLIKKYESVMTDADMDINFFWEDYDFDKEYDVVMSDVDLKEWESNPEPMLPTVADFRGLVYKASNSVSVEGLVNVLSSFKFNVQREPWMDTFYISNMKGHIDSFHLHDESYTKEYAEEMQNKIKGKYFFYQSNSQFSWAILMFGTEIRIVDKVIKPEYAEKYNNATNEIKKEIYESYPEYYFDCKYELFAVADKWGYYFDREDGEVIPMTLMEAPGELAYCKAVENYAFQISDMLSNAYRIYKNAPDSTRCEDYEPNTFYNNTIKKISNANFDFKTSCQQIVDYCRTQVVPWVKKRINALLLQTTDDDNANKFITTLSKRLNKNTGSLLLWYQNVISIDQEEENLDKEYRITRMFLKGLATAKCYSGNDETLSCNVYCPDYIDIKPLDGLYNSYKYSFNKGDTIYIVDDTHSEFSAKITSAEYKNMKKVDYENAETDGQSIYTGYIVEKVLRLHLDRKLPAYYSNGNDVNSLRVSKIC